MTKLANELRAPVTATVSVHGPIREKDEYRSRSFSSQKDFHPHNVKSPVSPASAFTRWPPTRLYNSSDVQFHVREWPDPPRLTRAHSALFLEGGTDASQVPASRWQRRCRRCFHGEHLFQLLHGEAPQTGEGGGPASGTLPTRLENLLPIHIPSVTKHVLPMAILQEGV